MNDETDSSSFESLGTHCEKFTVGLANNMIAEMRGDKVKLKAQVASYKRFLKGLFCGVILTYILYWIISK